VPRAPLTLSAASAVLLVLSAVSCDDDTGDITLGEVVRADVTEVVDAPATVVATSVATLTAAADGVLDELRAAPGERVTAGQVLAVIDSPAAERRLDQARQALAAADRAEVAGAPVGPDPATTQLATDRAAQEVFDHASETAGQVGDEELRQALLAQIETARQQYAAVSQAATEALVAARQGVASASAAVSAIGQAQRLQAQQAYDLAEATVEALTLRAPFDGVVQLGGTTTGQPATGLEDLIGAVTDGAGAGGALAAGDLTGGAGGGPGVDSVPAVGAPVSAGAPVVTVVDADAPVLLGQVDETDVLLVEPGVAAEVELDAAPGARYPATVRAVDVLPTQSARGGVAYQVRLDLGTGRWPDGSRAPVPRPGMSAIAHLQVRDAADAVAVPAAAVRRLGEADVVWRVRGGRAERVRVEVGVAGVDHVEIRSGLRPGDQIVVGGADRVSEGQRLP
jgi:multidrug efflux pump subunit AcrA (membrane-fusion protein)